MTFPYLCGDEVVELIDAHLISAPETLFIGNIGFSPDVLYFPMLLRAAQNVQFRFLHEQRPAVPAAITNLAHAREAELRQVLGARVETATISIIATDGAAIGGRTACAQVLTWLDERAYTDVVLDTTGMSRGTAFPIAKQLRQLSRDRGLTVHLIAADSDKPESPIKSISSDRADWIHGFAAASETDEFATALKVWVVQLSENGAAALDTMYRELNNPDEVCPVVPFPAANPLRADRLAFDLRDHWSAVWGETPMSFIHAHETDPMDVYRTVARMHRGRYEALTQAGRPSLTILSPVGRRLPGVGMLLAALENDLPIFYLETVGYDLSGPFQPSVNSTPHHRWHFRIDENVRP